MKNLVGIDLGTTTTLIAYLDETGDPKIYRNTQGEHITPSAVWIDPQGKVLIGTEAILQEEQGSKIWTEYKRDIAKGIIYDTINEIDITPETLSIFVLTKLRKDLESSEDASVVNTVVTWPANVSNEFREATLSCAKLAEWPIELGINEPTAAALYFALKENLTPGQYAVYDFGGGTWDLSIIEVAGTEVSVLDTIGIPQCGGKDLDLCLKGLIEEKFTAETGSTIDYSEQRFGKFENLKKSLTIREKIDISIKHKKSPVLLTITRDEFNKSISSILSQTEMVCSTYFEKYPEIIDVLLVGGSTRVPAVKQSLAKVFGKEGRTIANPDEVVALGAALYAGLKSDKENLTLNQSELLSSVNFNEIANHYLGIAALEINENSGITELVASYIINKGTRIPCNHTELFFTVAEGQKAVDLKVVQAGVPEKDLRFTSTLWEGHLPLPNDLPRGETIEVSFTISEDGTIHCSFTHANSGTKEQVSLAPEYEIDETKKETINKFLVE